MTAQPNFYQARYKLRWAAEHIAKAQTFWEAFCGTEFCTVGVEDVMEGGMPGKALVVRSTAPLPAELPLAIGDALHNLRAALDYVASELLHWKDKDATFPMHQTEENLKVTFETRVKKGKTIVGKNVVFEKALPGFSNLILKSLQPFQGGANKLWELSKLDNIDKHRLLIPVLVPLSVPNICGHDDHGNMISDLTVGLGPGGICHAVGMFGGSDLSITSHGTPVAEIFFQEKDVIDRQPVFATLEEMRQGVEDAITCIAAFAGSEGWSGSSSINPNPS